MLECVTAEVSGEICDECKGVEDERFLSCGVGKKRDCKFVKGLTNLGVL